MHTTREIIPFYTYGQTHVLIIAPNKVSRSSIDGLPQGYIIGDTKNSSVVAQRLDVQ